MAPIGTRCSWAAQGSELEREYHDTEWGVPLHGDAALFELLTLEGAQAGLSWRTVLAKRENYRTAFHGFDIARVAVMSDAALERLMSDAGLIRNRQKLVSVRGNARAALEVARVDGSLDAWLWSFVDQRPMLNRFSDRTQVPARTPISDRMSKELRKRGFRFVGSTICYAFMQASGMVNDHLVTCICHPDAAERAA